MPRRRRAKFESNLVIIDEPQVFVLKSKKTPIIALAVDANCLGGSSFAAASVTEKNWDRYLDGHVDLRYLFTYPFRRTLYSFSHSDWEDDEVLLTPWEGELPDAALPERGFFSRDHTESYSKKKQANAREELYIDGEWELDEFGTFYQRYADIYSFNAVIDNQDDPAIDQVFKGRAKKAFEGRPYKGGSSYLHVFGDLEGCLPRQQRLGLEGINYNSPGDVRINGKAEFLAMVESSVSNFVLNRPTLRSDYQKLYQYLSSSTLLSASAKGFDNKSAHSQTISQLAASLASGMQIDERRIETIRLLCGGNELVLSKIILAVFRRLEAASAFFAEGRMAFEKPD